MVVIVAVQFDFGNMRVVKVTFLTSIRHLDMASFQAVRKSVNLSPTVRALPTGVPAAPRLNLAARAPADGHGHGHGPAPRSDAPRSFTGGVKTSSVSRTYVCKCTSKVDVYSC